MKILSKNKKAFFDYEIQDTLTAGLVLFWHEVKSVKSGNVNIRDSFVYIRDWEAVITGIDIPLYNKTSVAVAKDYRSKRPRNLLLKKKEISRIGERLHKNWLVLLPLEIYISKTWFIKVNLGLWKLMKKVDKKEQIKDKDSKRQMLKEIKNLR